MSDGDRDLLCEGRLDDRSGCHGRGFHSFQCSLLNDAAARSPSRCQNPSFHPHPDKRTSSVSLLRLPTHEQCEPIEPRNRDHPPAYSGAAAEQEAVDCNSDRSIVNASCAHLNDSEEVT